MLSANQPKFKTDLNKLFKSAYIEAKKKTLPSTSGGDDSDICEYSKSVMNEAIEKEASAFADSLSEKLAQLITDYIKSASIQCVITTPLIATTPMGAGTVLGTINSSDFTIL